jgi:hypothetical protein
MPAPKNKNARMWKLMVSGERYNSARVVGAAPRPPGNDTGRVNLVENALPQQRKPDQAKRADDHPPPCEQVEAVPRHIVEKPFHHEPPGDK